VAPSSPWQQIVAAGLWRPGDPLRIHLGCGSLRTPGFLNVDFPPPAGSNTPEIADVYVDLFAVDFPIDEVDEVRLSFAEKPLSRERALDLLARANAWLRPGGALHVRADACEPAFETPEPLERALTSLGFGDVRVAYESASGFAGQACATLEATKSRSLSRDALREQARSLLAELGVEHPPTAASLLTRDANRGPLRITYLITSILAVTGGNMTLLNQVEELRRRGHALTIVTYTPRPAWTQIHADVVQVPAGEAMASCVPPSDVVVSTYCANTHELLGLDCPVKVYYAQGDQFVFGDDTPAPNAVAEEARQMLKEMSRRSYGLPGVHFVANSRNLAQAVLRHHGVRAEVVLPVCTDQMIFRPLKRALPGSRSRILIVGPDTRGSGVESLVFKGIGDIRRALELVAPRYPNFTAVRVSNTAAEIFRDFPCEYHLVPSDELKTYLFGTADFLLYGSHYDSCPRPPQEGMAAGCAVVCTDTSGAREYCVHEQNCLLVPVQNPQAMADAVLRLLGNRALYEKIVEGGKKTAAEYPREREWNELEALFYRYVDAARARPFAG
jgi:hypothetical protein